MNLWHRLLDGPLYTPPERLAALKEQVAAGTIPAIDLLRNFRRLNAECDPHVLGRAVSCARDPGLVPPYLYYLAEKGVPHFREELHDCLLRSHRRPLCGATAVLIDLSRDMQGQVAPGLTEAEIAACWAVALQSDYKRIFTVSGVLQEVEATPGLGGIERILMSQPPRSCHVAVAIGSLPQCDRVVVFTNKVLPSLRASFWKHCVSQPNFRLFDIDQIEGLYASKNGTKH